MRSAVVPSLCVAILATACATSVWADDSPATPTDNNSTQCEVMLRQAREGWRRLANAFGRCHGTGVRTEARYKSGKKASSETARVNFWVTDQWKRVDCRNDGKQETTVYSLNSKYGFRAAAPKEGNHYAVTILEPFDRAYWSGVAQGLPGRIEYMFHAQFREFVHAGWTMYGLPLDEIAQSNGFEIKECEIDGAGDEQRAEITFAWHAPHPDLPSCDRITLTLIPAMDYVIEKYLCDYDESAVSLSASYRMIDGIPVPHAVTRRAGDIRNPGTYLETRFEVIDFSFGALSEDVFKASALGISEPGEASVGGGPVRANRLRFLLYVNAVLLCVAGCWLFLTMRKRARRS